MGSGVGSTSAAYYSKRYTQTTIIRHGHFEFKESLTPMQYFKLLAALVLFSVSGYAQDVYSWPPLPLNKIYGERSQRDVSANITIDQLSSVGVALSSVVFKPYGYTLASLNYVYNILESRVQNLVVDLYWNSKLMKFQLCPVAFNNSVVDFAEKPVVQLEEYSCQVNMELNDLVQTVQSFVTNTNTNLAANLLTLVFNLHQLETSNITYDSSLVGTVNDTLPNVLNTYMNSGLFTPTLLQQNREANVTYNASTSDVDGQYGFPTLFKFLFDEKKRVIPIIWQDRLQPNSTYHSLNTSNETVFTSTSLNSRFDPFVFGQTLDSFEDRVKRSWDFIYDSEKDPFTNDTIHFLVDNGFLPILNHSLPNITDLSTMFNESLWSWAPDQPNNATIPDHESETSLGDLVVIQKVYQCATIAGTGFWTVSNCYESFPVICRHRTDEFKWILNANNGTYFEAYSDRCSGDYFFTVPKTALQQQSLSEYMRNIGADDDSQAWIDMNSIAINDCWVTGGPYASCPYQRIVGWRNFVKMLTPASIVCALVLFCIFLLKFRTVPVQGNRKHWKKLVNQFAENEKEGVPS